MIAALLRQTLADTTVEGDAPQTIPDMIARLDEQLRKQLNEILHAEAFQALESAWRGLNYLICNAQTDAQLKIRIMNVSKTELRQDLRLYPGLRWHHSSLFRQVYEAEFGRLGGEPYGCLIADYAFSHRPEDIRLLRDISKVAASAHAPFFAAADSTSLGMDSWADLAKARDVGEIFAAPDYAAWTLLRDAPDSRYIGLCLPRVLARLPYGAKANPVEDFAFAETTDGETSGTCTWMNAAYVMAVNIARAFKEFGWCARICGVTSGGEAINLPMHPLATDDGGVDPKCTTEIAISDRRQAELAELGLNPLIHRENTDQTAFPDARSLYRTADATAHDHLPARLPQIFAVSRFAHYLKCMVRDKSGAVQKEHELTAWLQSWLDRYVDGKPDQTDTNQAHKLLVVASVRVIENEENPGSYFAQFVVTPYCQFGYATEFNVSLADPWLKGAALAVESQPGSGTKPRHLTKENLKTSLGSTEHDQS